MESDTSGYTSGQMEFGVFNNVLANIWGQRAPLQNMLNASVEWSGNNFNTRVIASKNTNTRPSIVLEQVYQLNSYWSIGHQFSISGSNNMEDNWISKLPGNMRCNSVLRYNNEFVKVSVNTDTSHNITLRSNWRVSDMFTAGTELTVNVHKMTAKMTWIHKVVLANETEINGKPTIFSGLSTYYYIFFFYENLYIITIFHSPPLFCFQNSEMGKITSRSNILNYYKI